MRKIILLFLQLCLIDEYRINVNPIVVGGGKPLFKNIKDRIDLKLVETKTFSSGVVGLVYGVRRGEGNEERLAWK
ncbi:dihydrofolate reductase family protein [Paenibacillus sp. GCM10027629]|uniref:dihydrofolate reductase family protein n=1 Tax=Paenibacillus sp. GCM10027629 TaxID=3273414 RepID=UPI003645BA01